MSTEIISQDNGAQGKQSYGTEAVNQDLPAHLLVEGPYHYLQLRLGGATDAAYDGDDDSKLAIPALAWIERMYFYAKTAISANGVDIDYVAHSTGAASGPAVAAALVSASAGDWEQVDVEASSGALDLQATLGTALAAGEEAVVIVKYIPEPTI